MNVDCPISTCCVFFGVLCFSQKRYVWGCRAEGRWTGSAWGPGCTGLWVRHEREFCRAACLGGVFRSGACVSSLGTGLRASRMPASHGGISPGRNGHSTGNHSGKRHVYPGTGNEDSGGGAQSGIRRKTASLFCSLRIMGGRGLQAARHTWGWRSCGCNTGRAVSGPGSWVTAHTVAPLHCLQCTPCLQLCRN